MGLRQPSGSDAESSCDFKAPPPPSDPAPLSQSSQLTSSMERNSSWKRGHKRDMSAGTKSTMVWLKASEEYAEERRRRADLPPCVPADQVIADIMQEFDAFKRDDDDPPESTGLKLSDVQ